MLRNPLDAFERFAQLRLLINKAVRLHTVEPFQQLVFCEFHLVHGVETDFAFLQVMLHGLGFVVGQSPDTNARSLSREGQIDSDIPMAFPSGAISA